MYLENKPIICIVLQLIFFPVSSFIQQSFVEQLPCQVFQAKSTENAKALRQVTALEISLHISVHLEAFSISAL